MSRISKWKLEKTKVKVVFRLQFHATHIPLTGWDKLFISFIPGDSGKATAKTTKANVRNGTCKWGDPIYETTRLLQDSKSKQYDEKLYKLVVSMGSSRASTLGEATINLADYVDALKPSTVAHPLQGCDFGTILHITVQLLTSKTGFREFEQQRELRERGLHLGVDSHRQGITVKTPHSEDVTSNETDKVSERIKLKQDANELSSFEEEASLTEEYAGSAAGFDGSSPTSESLYIEKHETSNTHETDSLKSTISGDLHVLPQCQSPCPMGGLPNHQKIAQGSTCSGQGWGLDSPIYNELAMSLKDNHSLRESSELAESSFLILKLEVSSLQSLADELGAETQKFSHLLAAEISSSEKLQKEVSFLRSECLKFKEDIIRLKDLKVSPQVPIIETSDNQANDLTRSMQLQFLNGIAVVEGKIRELKNKACVASHDGDAQFFYLELESLLNFLLNFKLGNGEATASLNTLPSEKAGVKEIRELSANKDNQFVSGNGLGLDFLCLPETNHQHFAMITPVSEVGNPLGAIDGMKGQIFDLVRELGEAKVEKETLTEKLNQMECYYEALVQELEEHQKRLLGELQHLRNEHSTCLHALSSSRAEMELMREDMNQQMLQFVEERRDLEALNQELERRVTTSESALRRARLNYSIAVDKLQRDLELLSSQVVSMFETNENLIKQALPLQPHSQGDPKLLQNPEDVGVRKLSEFQNENLGLRKRLLGGDILLEDLKRSFCLQEELYQKVEKELIDMYSVNLHLDIYSKLLQESLCEADTDIRNVKEKMNGLVEELKLSIASQNHLMARLEKATDDIHVLNEYKSSSISQCGDMALQNQLLEDKLESVSNEKYLLSRKLEDCESTMMEYRNYQTKYGACLAEKEELSFLLKQEAFENEKLKNEMILLKENLIVLKSESDELVSFKESLEGKFRFVQEKLTNLLESNKQLCFSANCHSLNLESMDIQDVVLQLEKIQHHACVKICQLMEENQNLQSERDIADVSLSTVGSEILAMKQKFRNDIQDMVTQLDASNALVAKLQVEIESVASKLHSSSEIEEKYAQQSKVLLADLALLEDQMQELTCENGLFAQDILGLDALAEELGRSKLTIAELICDKHELTMCLQSKTEESIKFSCEISGLKEDLKNLHDKLHEEKSYKDELEGKVRDLTSHLNGDQEKLLIFEQQKAELAVCLQGKSEESTKLSSEICDLKEDLKNLQGELQEEKAFRGDLEAKVRDLTSQLYTNQDKLHILEQQKAELAMCLQGKSEESIKLSHEISNLKESLKNLHDKLREEMAYKGELEAKVRDLTSDSSRDRDKLLIFEQQKAELAISLQDKSDESIMLSIEISCLTEKLKNLHEELHKEKAYKDELEAKVTDLTSHLSREQEKLLHLEQEKAELVHVGELVSDFKLGKSGLAHLLTQQNVFIEKLKTDNFYRGNLESQLLEMYDYSLAEDVKLVYLTNHYEALLGELLQKLMSSEGCLRELSNRYHNTEAMLNHCLAREANWNEEKTNLLINLNSLRSDLEAYGAQNKFLVDSNSETRGLLEDCNWKLTMMKTSFSLNNVLQACEVEWMKTMIMEAEEEISYLTLSKEELDILVIAFKGKVDELSADMTLLEAHKDELAVLRSQCSELSQKLSEQILRTEEFKNLSTHLKELKDKAEAECLVAREKRETDVPPAAAHDSLRIAFIKEQYETKIQELKQQLSVSKRHGEEMLLKLQDAIDEVENRKKSEAGNLKRNEELSIRLSALESELQSALAERREKNNAYDRTKAELECALLSLECCKEEKEKLEASFLEFEAEKSRLAMELSSWKGQLETLKSSNKNLEKDEYGSVTEGERKLNGSTGNSFPIFLEQDESTCGNQQENVLSIQDGEIAFSTDPLHLQSVKGAASLGLHQIPEVFFMDKFSESNGKNVDVNKEPLGSQNLKSTMEHLYEELEKMKNENTVFDIGHDVNQEFQGPQREITQLQKANEELRSMFPFFDEISGGGNALERVLALEIELAEALKAKNKSNVQFQSSFLRQHGDEEGVFKSFRDINELIRETLELKGRHAVMEAELREMHDRYSQLSLQFAEVEGERQKLKMTLKNVRSRKLVALNQSNTDHPS